MFTLRKCCPNMTMRFTPACFAALMMRVHSSTLAAIGLSTRTCFPAGGGRRGKLRVSAVRRAEEDRVNIGASEQRLHAGRAFHAVIRGELRSPATAGDGHEFRTLQIAADRLCVGAAHESRTDYSDSQIVHWHSIPSILTGCSMRKLPTTPAQKSERRRGQSGPADQRAVRTGLRRPA